VSTPPVAPRNLGRRVIWGMLFAVAVYGAYFVIGGTSKIAAELAHFSWGAFVIACLLSFANYGLRFAKWEYYLAILGIRGIPKGESLLTFLSGFILTITPGKVGEVFKSVVLHETRGVDMVRTAPIVVAERLTDLIGVIALIAVGSLSLDGGLLWAGLGAAAVTFLLLFVSVRPIARAFLDPLPRLPGGAGRFFGRAVPKIDGALDSLRELVTPRRLILPSILSFVGWSMEGFGVYVLLRGFGVTTASPLAAAFSYATATLAGALIPVPGGLGVTEKVLEETMIHAATVADGVARAAMLLSRLATLWFAVAIGFFAFALLKRKYRDLFATRPAGSE
jgi:glycosyltransferase 2 family protein